VGRFSQGLSVRDGRRLLLRSSDELRKGAALTQVQIAELVLCEPDVTVRSLAGERTPYQAAAMVPADESTRPGIGVEP
jgi:N-acetylmuramic acid 6-phosphate (MurNAc-6-P) etherase